MSKVTTKARAARRRRRWTQQQLGFYAGVGAGDVSRIENGRLVPYPSQAEKLGRLLGLKPTELQEAAEEPETVEHSTSTRGDD